MKKKLNVAHVANELAGGSAFFPSYQAPLPQAPATKSPVLSPTPSHQPNQHENTSPAPQSQVSAGVDLV